MYYIHFVSFPEMSANSNKLFYIPVVLAPRDAYLDVLFSKSSSISSPFRYCWKDKLQSELFLWPILPQFVFCPRIFAFLVFLVLWEFCRNVTDDYESWQMPFRKYSSMCPEGYIYILHAKWHLIMKRVLSLAGGMYHHNLGVWTSVERDERSVRSGNIHLPQRPLVTCRLLHQLLFHSLDCLEIDCLDHCQKRRGESYHPQ